MEFADVETAVRAYGLRRFKKYMAEIRNVFEHQARCDQVNRFLQKSPGLCDVDNLKIYICRRNLSLRDGLHVRRNIYCNETRRPFAQPAGILSCTAA